jgi:hypothetical protein
MFIGSGIIRSATSTSCRPRPLSAGLIGFGTTVRHASWGEGMVERATDGSVPLPLDTAGFKPVERCDAG